jgi:hypothetical protein
MWRIDPLLGNARNIQPANNRAVFSVVRAQAVAMQRTLNTFSRTRCRYTTEDLFSAVVRAECL